MVDKDEKFGVVSTKQAFTRRVRRLPHMRRYYI